MARFYQVICPVNALQHAEPFWAVAFDRERSSLLDELENPRSIFPIDIFHYLRLITKNLMVEKLMIFRFLLKISRTNMKAILFLVGGKNCERDHHFHYSVYLFSTLYAGPNLR